MFLWKKKKKKITNSIFEWWQKRTTVQEHCEKLHLTSPYNNETENLQNHSSSWSTQPAKGSEIL